jgi:hypothetical protein
MPRLASDPAADSVTGATPRPRSQPRHHRRSKLDIATLLGLAGVAAYLVALTTDGTTRGYQSLVSVDTIGIIRGSHVALGCLSHHVFSGCGVVSRRTTSVLPYPLLQYLVVIPAIKLGMSDRSILHALSRVNAVAFVATMVFLAAVGRRLRRPGWGTLLVVFCVSGPLAYYAVTGLGEMPALLFATLFVGAVLTGRPVLAGVILAIACLGKETFAPFLFALGVICGRRPEDRWLPRATVLVALICGASAGVTLDAAFNVFRFGSPLNQAYLNPLYRTPGLRYPTSFSAAIWLSPNAGLLFFWPVAVLLIVVGVGVPLRRMGTSAEDLRRWLPAAALLVVIAGYTVSLGFWWAPFGWIAWGPRLVLPLIPAFVLAALHVGGQDARRALGKVVVSQIGIAVLILIAVAGVLPQVGAVWNFTLADNRLFTLDQRCPKSIATFNVTTDPPLYYRCLENAAWRRHSLILPAAARPGGVIPRLGQLSAALAVAALLLAARRRFYHAGTPPGRELGLNKNPLRSSRHGSRSSSEGPHRYRPIQIW